MPNIIVLPQSKFYIIKDYKTVEKFNEKIKVMEEQEGFLTEFDDKIFNALIDRIEVLESTNFVFVLKNGMRIEENIDKIQRI